MKIKYLIIAFLSIGLSSCSHFEELNTDPASSTIPDPASLISTVQLRISGERETTWRSMMSYHMPFTQMISDNYNCALGQVYMQRTDYIDKLWNSYYRDINDLQSAINEGSKKEVNVNYVAVARIMKVLIFSQLTDTYGDIPYFEAATGNLHPKYNTQQEIYTDLFKELKEASSQLTPDYKLEGDLIYYGNVEKWKKFANSLRLRLAMRLIHVDNATAKTEAEAAVADGVFQSVGDGAVVMHADYNVSSGGAPEIRGNGFSQAQNFSEQITVVCDTYVGYLRENDDPRLKMMFGIYGVSSDMPSTSFNQKSTTITSIDATEEYEKEYGPLRGFPPGRYLYDPIEEPEYDPNYWSWSENSVEVDGKNVIFTRYFKALQIRRELTRLDMPTAYQPYSEVLLWQAEMATYGWNNGGEDAKTLLKEAVEVSITELGKIYKSNIFVSYDVDEYVDKIIASASDDMFQAINMQHYVNNFFNGIESFANWRRSGFPLLKAASHEGTDATLQNLIPRRLSYPASETNYNNENMNEFFGPDFTNFWGEPVWWDGDKHRGVQ
jgi:hypothetical protein